MHCLKRQCIFVFAGAFSEIKGDNYEKEKMEQISRCSVVGGDGGIAFIRLWEKEQGTGK